MATILWIGLGGFLGANTRFWLGMLVSGVFGSRFPWATGLVNISGGLLIGFIATLFADHTIDNESLRLFLIVGLLGGYTTFSTYTWESLALLQDGRWLPAIGYIVGSNVLSILACVAGVLIARTWM